MMAGNWVCGTGLTLARQSPIVLVGHSMGGLVIKKVRSCFWTDKF